MGKLREGEIETFMTAAEKVARIEPQGKGRDYSAEDVRSQARRCLHCDCRKAENCKLRDYAQNYGATSSKFKTQRQTFVQKLQHPRAVFEPGKCIDCGLCIQIASKAGEELGLTFIGRGFDVAVAVPFDRSIAEGLQRAAQRCVAACPTGALALKENLEADE
jgi:NADH dehydrogenase/NADH:ubiquinone oxidoreductase subunit G